MFALAVGTIAEDYQSTPLSAPLPVMETGDQAARLFNKRVAEGNVDLIFIGDSITHAWENAGGGLGQALHQAQRREPRHQRRPHQHVLWRLDNGNVKNISPKVAVVMIGTNNSVRAATPPRR